MTCFCLVGPSNSGADRATSPLVSLYPALECRAIMQHMSPTAFGECAASFDLLRSYYLQFPMLLFLLARRSERLGWRWNTRLCFSRVTTGILRLSEEKHPAAGPFPRPQLIYTLDFFHSSHSPVSIFSLLASPSTPPLLSSPTSL